MNVKMTTEQLERTVKSTITTETDPERLYFEVQGKHNLQSPDAVIGYLTTTNRSACLDTLADNTRFKMINAKRVILCTENSAHYNLDILEKRTVTKSETSKLPKGYQLDSYMFINQR